jgi:hypothetical protein
MRSPAGRFPLDNYSYIYQPSPHIVDKSPLQVQSVHRGSHFYHYFSQPPGTDPPPMSQFSCAGRRGIISLSGCVCRVLECRHEVMHFAASSQWLMT